MCKTCWEQEGSPSIINERTIKGAELIKAVYESEDGGVGGYAHIVVDDWNMEDSNIDFCLNAISDGDLAEETAKACKECLTFLKSLTYEERCSALAINDGFIKVTA